MKIRVLFALIICILFNTIYSKAQKTKNMGIELPMPDYPLVVLPESFKTYKTTFVNQGIDLKEFPGITNPEEKIELSDFQKTTDLADLNIAVKIGQLNLFRNLSPTRVNSLAELKEYSPTTIVDYFIEVTFEVTDNKNIVIQREFTTAPGVFSSESQKSVTPQHSTIEALHKNVSNYTNQCVVAINDRLRDLFDIQQRKFLINLYGIKSSKTENFDEYVTVIRNMDDVFTKTPKNEAAIRDVVKTAITFWETKYPAIDQTNEDGKARAFVCLYDLSFACAMLNDFTKADDYVKKAVATAVEPRMAEYADKSIQKLKVKYDTYVSNREKATKEPGMFYQKHGRQQAPTLSTIFDGNKPQEATSALEKGFIITTTGDTLFGSFVEFNVNFKNGKMLFVENGKSQKVLTVPYESIQKLSLGGVLYLYNKGLKKVLYHSPSLFVLASRTESVFSFSENGLTRTYTMFDPNDGAAYITNYKKKLGEIFNGVCPVVQDKSVNGEYDLKQEGSACVLPAIKDYEMQCGSKEYDKYISALDTELIKKLYR